MMEPKEGLLTFRAEGNNIPGNRYYSRIIHWPGIASKCGSYGSGVTIGRGYDMKYRPVDKIKHDLTLAGVPFEKTKKIADGSNKSHCAASEFVKINRDKIEEITESQQLKLFEITYREYVKDSIRFYNKYKKIDSVSWEKLHPALKDVFVDMKYQGSLKDTMVSVFGVNKKENIISLIKNNATLLRDEPARGRIKYLQGNIQ